LRFSTVARLRHFMTVLGLRPNSRLSCASEACYRCVAVLTACVVVALPRPICSMVLPSIPAKGSHRQTVGSNTSAAFCPACVPVIPGRIGSAIARRAPAAGPRFSTSLQHRTGPAPGRASRCRKWFRALSRGFSGTSPRECRTSHRKAEGRPCRCHRPGA
jgi:hypothetical protein